MSHLNCPKIRNSVKLTIDQHLLIATMCFEKHHLNRLQKFASFVLLALLVYQLGACPCGCLEHNVWMEIVGFGSDHEPVEITNASLLVSAPDEHDCTGVPKAQYVNNARSITGSGEYLNSGVIAPFVLSDTHHEKTRRFPSFDKQADSLAVAHALSRPALQVFQL